MCLSHPEQHIPSLHVIALTVHHLLINIQHLPLHLAILPHKITMDFIIKQQEIIAMIQLMMQAICIGIGICHATGFFQGGDVLVLDNVAMHTGRDNALF